MTGKVWALSRIAIQQPLRIVTRHHATFGERHALPQFKTALGVS